MSLFVIHKKSIRLLLLISITISSACQKEQELTLNKLITHSVQHPADIIFHNGYFWVTELMSKHVTKLDPTLSKKISVITHPNKNKQFASPHHLAENKNALYFSEGWGSSIYQYQQSKLIKHHKKFNAPHGICIKDKWLYVADSLNSKLKRINLNTPTQIETFSDIDKKIAYGRQLLCRDDGIWLSNSYEKREHLNTGQGSSVLHIKDFHSGKADVIAQFSYSNMTGITIIKNRYLIIALWHANQIIKMDLQTKKTTQLTLPQQPVGPAYGMRWDEEQQRLLICFIGDIFHNQYQGAIAQYQFQ